MILTQFFKRGFLRYACINLKGVTMKKLRLSSTIVLLALFMTFLFPDYAVAKPDEVLIETIATIPSVPALNLEKTYNGKAEVLDFIYKALELPAREYTINVKNLSQSDVTQILDGCLENTQRSAWIEASWTRNNKITALEISVTDNVGIELRKVVYGGGSLSKLSDRAKELYPTVKTILDSLITKDMTDYDKELKIHDYIVLNTAYDHDNFIKNTIPDSSYTIEGLLNTGLAVCQGYAETFKMFMDILGIDCYVISGYGDGLGHAWNAIKLDDEWYYVDVTWDDPTPDVPGNIDYGYLNVTAEQLAQDHSWDDIYGITATADKYNYYIKSGLAAYSDADFLALAKKSMKNGQNSFSCYTYYDTDVDKLMELLVNEFNKSVRVSYSGNSYNFTIVN